MGVRLAVPLAVSLAVPGVCGWANIPFHGFSWVAAAGSRPASGIGRCHLHGVRQQGPDRRAPRRAIQDIIHIADGERPAKARTARPCDLWR